MKILSNLKAIAISIMVIAVVLHACRKIDYNKKDENEIAIREKFFTIKPGTDPAVVGVAASIKRQDNKRGFIPNLIKKAGYPLWDKAQIFSKSQAGNRSFEEEQQVFIPFAPENEEQTKAILIVKLSGEDTLYHLLYGTQYGQYGFDSTTSTDSWNGREIFRAFTAFDNANYGHTKFLIKDNRLLDGNTDTIGNDPVLVEIENINNGSQGRLKAVYAMTIWISYVVCGECYGFKTSTASRLTTPCCNATYFSGPVTFWFDDGTSDWGWFPPEGGGGGGLGDPCPGCNWEETNPCVEPDPNMPQIPCDDQWQPATGTNPEPFDPNIYDSVGVSNGLQNAYPCIAALINDSLKDANWIAQIAGKDVFNDEIYTHITFDTSTINTTKNGIVASTRTDTIIGIDPNGNTHFFANVTLNGWYLRNSTKNFVISNIIHEAMHAVFKLRWGQYQIWLNSGVGTIDSFYIKEHFPIHWSYLMHQQPSEEQQHIIMGTDYLNKFVDIGKLYYDPSAPTAVRDSVLKAFALCGLRETSIWKLLQGMGVDTCNLNIIEKTASEALIGTFNFPGCGTFTTHYAYSLYLKPPCN